jgi:hypothetical protein
MSLDIYFFTFFVPFYPDFPACHLLRHSFSSAHFPLKKKQVDVQSLSGFCLFGWLVVCVFVYLRFGARLPIFTKLVMDGNNHPCRSAIVLALYEVHINLLYTSFIVPR